MTRMAKIVAAALVLSTPAAAQITVMQSNNPAPIKGDPNRMVCEVEQTIGTRLGARKVCKTVHEWQELRMEHRETVAAFEQRNTSVGCQEGNACNGGTAPPR
jgi:hypothetical protein